MIHFIILLFFLKSGIEFLWAPQEKSKTKQKMKQKTIDIMQLTAEKYLYIMANGKRKWFHGVVIIITAQLHSIKLELSFCKVSDSARGVSEIPYGKDLSVVPAGNFCWSARPQKQFIIVIIIIIIIIIKLESQSCSPQTFWKLTVLQFLKSYYENIVAFAQMFHTAYYKSITCILIIAVTLYSLLCINKV